MVSGDHVLNAGGLRFADEFVRHKLLDAFGDLYLAGGPIIGHFRGVRSGHALTRRLLAALFADRDAWCYTTIVEADSLRRAPRGTASTSVASPAPDIAADLPARPIRAISHECNRGYVAESD